jgi:hypothetical protein
MNKTNLLLVIIILSAAFPLPRSPSATYMSATPSLTLDGRNVAGASQNTSFTEMMLRFTQNSTATPPSIATKDRAKALLMTTK